MARRSAPAAEQVGGEGVAQRVRRGPRGRARRRRRSGPISRSTLRAVSRPPRALRNTAPRRASIPAASARGAIALERPQRRAAHRDDALLASLAEDAHRAALGVEPLPVEAGQLGHAQPRGVEQLEHGAVAQPEQRVAPRHAEQAIDVVEAQVRGQRAPDASAWRCRRWDRARGARCDSRSGRSRARRRACGRSTCARSSPSRRRSQRRTPSGPTSSSARASTAARNCRTSAT